MRKKQKYLKFSLSVLMLFLFYSNALGGTAFQNFELIPEGDFWTGDNTVSEVTSEQAHSGNRSCKVTCSSAVGTTFIPGTNPDFPGSTTPPRPPFWDFSKNDCDQINLWIYSLSDDQEDEYITLEISHVDESWTTHSTEIKTTTKTKHSIWTQLTVFFNNLPSGVDLSRIVEIKIKTEKPGIYYIDDLQVVRGPLRYQSFEDMNLEDCVTVSQGNSTINFTTPEEPTFEGEKALKVVVSDESKLEIKSKHTAHNAFDTDKLHIYDNDKLSFWVNSDAQDFSLNYIGQDIELHFYDNLDFQENPIKVVPQKTEKVGHWVKMEASFRKFRNYFNLSGIEKLELVIHCPGTYYIDNFKTSNSCDMSIKQGNVDLPIEGPNQLNVTWDYWDTNTWYNVLQNLGDNSWIEASGLPQRDSTFNIYEFSPRKYRVRKRDVSSNGNEISPFWDYSIPRTYIPQQIEISKKALLEGRLEYTMIPDSTENYIEHEVEVSNTKHDENWESFQDSHLLGSDTKWFRVRSVKSSDPEEASEWSEPICNKDFFLKTHGTRIIGYSGEEVVLRGVNLGGYLALDRTLTGLGNETTLRDEHSIRDKLLDSDNEAMLEDFRSSFIQSVDFDLIRSMGANLVRLPINYRLFMDRSGDWIDDEVAFAPIDWVIEECAKRNLYVLLDLHGAPGGQSNLAHCGQEGDLNSNMLFLFELHQNDTVTLWEKIANRYKDNTTIMGYDLLNEPLGYERANKGYEPLWQLYGRLYQAIRNIDGNHIIVIEGAPDWDSLPDPETYSWENVAYQFQWFPKVNDEYATAKHFNHDMEAMYDSHKLQLDNHLENLETYQKEYNIPVMVGAFNCFESKQSWKYYLDEFNKRDLSWALWSYKSKTPQSNWGLVQYGDCFVEGDYPDFENSIIQEIPAMLKEHDTLNNYLLNEELIDFVTPYLKPTTKPYLVASYSFDEMEGGMVPDISGNGYDAELHSGPTLSDDAVAGKSMNFVRGDFLQTNKGNPLAGAETFTVSLWFKTHLEEPEGTLPNIKFLSSAEWHIGANATGWNVGLHYPEGWADHQQGSIHYNDDPWDRSDTGVYPKSDEWNNLVIVYDGVRVKEYLNGVISVDHLGSGRPLGSGRDYMQIGTWDGGFPMEGLMDEIQIYRGALSEETILKVYEEYERGLPKAPVLVTHYNFDEIVSNQVLDVSGNGYDADIFGNPSLVYDSVQEMAMEFNQGDYLRANTGNPLDGTKTFTVSLWFKTRFYGNNDILPDYRFLSSADWHGGNDATGWYIGSYFSKAWADNQMGIYLAPGSVWDRSILDQHPLPDVWNHLVVVYDGVRVKEYLNGELSVDLPGSGITLGEGQPYMDIGQWMNSFNMVGLMDEVKIFRTALVESQVKELYDVINIPKNLCVGHWGTAYGAGQFKARTYDRSPSPRNLPRLPVSKGDLFEFDFTLHHGSSVRFEFVEGFYANQQPYSPVFRKTFENVEGRNTVQILMDRDFDLDRIAAHVYVGDNPLTSNIDVHSVRRIATGIPFAQIEPLGGLEMRRDTITVELTQQEGVWIELDGSSSHVTQEGNIIESYIWSSPSFEGDINGSTLLTRLGLGTHVISLKVFDGVSYSFAKEVTVEVVDTVAPSLTILTPKQRSYRTKYVYLDVKTRVTDASGACQLKYTLNDNELQSNRIDLASNIGENNVLEVTATDSAGNSTTKNVTFKIR